MGKKNKSKEYDQTAAIIKGILNSNVIQKNPLLNRTIMPDDRKKRRFIVKWFLMPLYLVGFPILTILLFYFGYWPLGIIGVLFTIYGYLKAFMGDRWIIYLMMPMVKRMLKGK